MQEFKLAYPNGNGPEVAKTLEDLRGAVFNVTAEDGSIVRTIELTSYVDKALVEHKDWTAEDLGTEVFLKYARIMRRERLNKESCGGRV